MKGLHRKLALTGAVLVATAACGAETVDGGQTSETAREAVTAEDVLEGFKLFSFDFTPIRSKQGLARTASLIVRGKVEEVVTGRVSGKDDDPFAAQYSAVHVSVDETLKGEAPANGVWFEVRTTPAILGDALPPGLDVGLYLVPADPGTEDLPFTYEEAEFPVGEPLWQLSHPQGLVVQYGEQRGVVVPMSKEVRPTAKVEDELP